MIWCVVVAAGAGDRFGGPKQFAVVAGRRVVDWSVAAARPVVDGLVVVVPPETSAEFGATFPADVVVVDGGISRSESVRHGLAAVPAEAHTILVHDAARPLATAELFTAVIAALTNGADGSVPAVPVTDTIRSIDGPTVDRSTLVAVQTPQAFRASVLRDAHAAGGDATDDASLVELAGGTVVVVDGEANNRKITHPEDLLAAEAILGR